MSKKTLLNENTIRRFMKLAEIEALTSPFLETRDPLEEDEPGGDPVYEHCLLYTSPSPRDGLLSRMPSSA